MYLVKIMHGEGLNKIFWYDENEPMEYGIVRMKSAVNIWLHENIHNSWSHETVAVQGDQPVNFNFADEGDSVLFKLRWG